jgi:hypothetical protein
LRWAFGTNDGERSPDELEIWHRAKASVENRIKEGKLGFALDNLPCHAKRLRFRFIAVAASVGRSGRRLILRLGTAYAFFADFVTALHRIRSLARAPA